MKRVATVERAYIECDGCDYVVSLTPNEKREGVELASRISVLTIPWRGEVVEFHFHAPYGLRRDCFRYWAHAPHVMKRGLERRGWDEKAIDEFMATHLYREGPHRPGLARPKEEAQR